MDMILVEFCKRIKKERKFTDISNILLNDDNVYYHVIIHKSALKTFDENLLYFAISPLFHNEHLHLIVQPHDQKPLKNNARIRSERIETESKLQFIFKRLFFKFRKREYDYFCGLKLTISSLKDMCITSIVENLNYLHNTEKLNFPKTLLEDIFQQSKSQFCYLPESDSQISTADNAIFENFIQQDIVLHKKIVVWFQFGDLTDDLFESYGPLVVYYHFKIARGDKITLCLKCMKFENKNGCYVRNYSILNSRFKFDFIKNPINWCRACQQVPLFQILTCIKFGDLYGYDLFKNQTYYNIMRGGITHPITNLFFKKDYFENSVKVKSKYFYHKNGVYTEKYS